jgi:hypothetical protein
VIHDDSCEKENQQDGLNNFLFIYWNFCGIGDTEGLHCTEQWFLNHSEKDKFHCRCPVFKIYAVSLISSKFSKHTSPASDLHSESLGQFLHTLFSCLKLLLNCPNILLTIFNPPAIILMPTGQPVLALSTFLFNTATLVGCLL